MWAGDCVCREERGRGVGSGWEKIIRGQWICMAFKGCGVSATINNWESSLELKLWCISFGKELHMEGCVGSVCFPLFIFHIIINSYNGWDEHLLCKDILILAYVYFECRGSLLLAPWAALWWSYSSSRDGKVRDHECPSYACSWLYRNSTWQDVYVKRSTYLLVKLKRQSCIDI